VTSNVVSLGRLVTVRLSYSVAPINKKRCLRRISLIPIFFKTPKNLCTSPYHLTEAEDTLTVKKYEFSARFHREHTFFGKTE
jgi:hypothetical protein